MSEFAVRAVLVRGVEPIPNADRIELAIVGDYRCVSQKGRFQPGDLAVYLPEAAVLPLPMIQYLEMEGKLAGPNHDRIKAVRLRGCLSQGILLKPHEVLEITDIDFGDLESADAFMEGADLTSQLKVTKWEPPIPTHMQGEVAAKYGMTVPYDIENFKSYPDVLIDGEVVEFTEKLHGTFCAVTRYKNMNDPWMINTDTMVYSKGLGKQGLVFKDNEANQNNLYVRTIKEMEIGDRLARSGPPNNTVTIFGEIYGPGVQDLHYGNTKPGFSVFDIYFGKPHEGLYLSREYLDQWCNRLGLMRVPVLYRGPFSRTVMDEHTNGKTVCGAGVHVREGIVITPETERRDNKLGRVILKSVSADYLFRKGNQTEYN